MAKIPMVGHLGVVRTVLYAVSVGFIVATCMNMHYYTQIKTKITGVTTRCKDNPLPADIDTCINKVDGLADVIFDSVKENFETGLWANAVCKSATHKWKDEPDSGVCLNTWIFNDEHTDTGVGGFNVKPIVDTAAPPHYVDTAPQTTIHENVYDTAVQPQYLYSYLKTTATASGDTPTVTHLSVHGFKAKCKFGDKNYNAVLETYVREYITPMPFDGKAHADVSYSSNKLYRNLNEFSFTKNMSLSKARNFETVGIATLFSNVYTFSSEYYTFHQAWQYQIVILSFSLLGVGAILLADLANNAKLKEGAMISNFVRGPLGHWLFTTGYLVSVFTTVALFSVVMSTKFHGDMYRALDTLLDDDAPTEFDYRTSADSNDRLMDIFPRLHMAWIFQLILGVISLTAHFSLKYGPLMKQLLTINTETNFPEINKGSKVPAFSSKAVQYLPLVSVAR